MRKIPHLNAVLAAIIYKGSIVSLLPSRNSEMESSNMPEAQKPFPNLQQCLDAESEECVAEAPSQVPSEFYPLILDDVQEELEVTEEEPAEAPTEFSPDLVQSSPVDVEVEAEVVEEEPELEVKPNVEDQDSEECIDEALTEVPPDLPSSPPIDAEAEAEEDEERFLLWESDYGPPELDPMLEKMPHDDFLAYKRQDISSMYQEPPGSRVEMTPEYNGIGAKFVNMSPERLDLTWDIGEGPPGMMISHPGPFESGDSSTFPNLMFYFIRPTTQQIVCSIKTKPGTSIYYCDPFHKTNKTDPSSGIIWGPVRSMDEMNEEERALYDAAQYNREFGKRYEEFTGSPWYGNMPQEPPRHFMHRADYFGQTHTIPTVETRFTSLPPEDQLYHKLSVQEMKRNYTSKIPFAEYREKGIFNITILAGSVAPRIFIIDDFLSHVEADHIIDLANRKGMYRSTTGKGVDMKVTVDRSSQTTWMPRYYSPVMDAIFKRAADVLKIDEALYRHRLPDERPDYPNRIPICENFQVLHYLEGTEYAVHTDHGYPDARPNWPTRSINIVIYLNEGMEGGETAFPRWRNAHTDGPIAGVPKKGRAVIFYMKNPDGNMDDLSQHSANLVTKGEKWFANLWTWDPYRDEIIP